MTYEQILKELQNKVYKPVYFLSGEENYYIDALSDYIAENVLDENEREFNQSILYGKDVDMGTVLSEAKRFPMMASHQVVIVKEAQNIRDFSKEKSDAEPKKGKEKPKDPFIAYLENPQTSTILVFCYKYKKLDKRTAVAKTIEKNGVFFESPKLYDNQVPGWITNYLKEKKYSINPKAAALLTEYLGNDLSKIANELQKLIINIPAGKEINTEHVQQNVGISKDYNVFELQKALGTKDVVKANRIINYFAANPKENPMVLILSNLFGFFSKMALYHSLPDKSKMAVASALKVNPFFVSDYEVAARSYSLKKVVDIINYLRECDGKTKGIGNSSASDGDLMKELIFKILH